MAALRRAPRPPALLGGRILPLWDRPLPAWWPASLRGVLTILEHEGAGEFRSAELPWRVEPYGANLIVERAALLAVGGFDEGAGRRGAALLSDEDVRLAWRLQAAGRSARYESRILVWHRIHASRLNPDWLLARLYWQGVSTVATRFALGEVAQLGREAARRAVVALLLLPAALVPRRSTRFLGPRWRLAYSLGYLRGLLALGEGPKREA
jgi:hypothetical protein